MNTEDVSKKVIRKALLIPINSKKEILIQDRRNYKKPDWGFFGGGVEEGETYLEAVIREAKEELDLEIEEKELIFLGEFKTLFRNSPKERQLFLYRTDRQDFTVLEGQGAHWMDFETAKTYLDIGDRFEEIYDWINKNC